MFASELVKLRVFDSNAKVVGKVKDFNVDEKSLSVTHFVLELEDPVSKEIFGEKPLIGKTTARAPTSLIEKVGDAVILKSSINEIKGRMEKL